MKQFQHTLIFHYPPKAKEELKARIGNIITRLRDTPEIKAAITHEKGVYTVDPSGPKKFRNSCMKLITKYEEEENKITLQDWM